MVSSPCADAGLTPDSNRHFRATTAIRSRVTAGVTGDRIGSGAQRFSMTPGYALILLGSGFAAGLFGSLLGLGGGVLIVPILVLLLKIPIHFAIATSLLGVIATSSAAASKYVRLGVANVRLGMSLELFTVAGALGGSLLAGVLRGTTLMTIFAVAMLLMAIPMARGGSEAGTVVSEPDPDRDRHTIGAQLGGDYFDAAEGHHVRYDVQRIPVAAGVASLAGILSGLLGIGGGLIKVPSLTLFCNVPMKAAAATSNFIIGVTAVASTWIYYSRGQILPVVSAATVIGVFAGSRTGSVLAGRSKGKTLRRIFAAVMLVIAVEMLLKARGISLT